MAKMVEITLGDGLTFEVDEEACGQYGFQAGDSIKLTGAKEAVTLLGVARVPEGCEAHCVDPDQPLLWVRTGDDRVFFVPPSIARNFHKVD